MTDLTHLVELMGDGISLDQYMYHGEYIYFDPWLFAFLEAYINHVFIFKSEEVHCEDYPDVDPSEYLLFGLHLIHQYGVNVDDMKIRHSKGCNTHYTVQLYELYANGEFTEEKM